MPNRVRRAILSRESKNRRAGRAISGDGPWTKINAITVTDIGNSSDTKVQTASLGVNKLGRCDVGQGGKIIHEETVILALEAK